MELPENIELFDGGTLGVDLMPYIEGKEKLIVIDSVDAGEKPGTLFRFRPDDLNYEEAPKTSVHQIGLIESLQMVKLFGKVPDEVVIFGVQPGLIDWGEELTDEVKAAVPKLIKHILKEIEKLEIKNPKLEE
jgi:hydrogenase maturation protease